MTPDLVTRSIHPDDFPFLKALFASTRAEEFAGLNWGETERSAFFELQFTAQHRHYHGQYPDAEFLILLRENIPIGRLYLARMSVEFRLIDISLLPEHRRQGIGTRLLHQVSKEAAAAAKPLRLQVARTNPAFSLYERLGFVVVASGPVYLQMEKSPPKS